LNDKERVTVREYIEAMMGNCKEHCRDKFVDMYNTLEILFEKQEQALKLARGEMDNRLHTMNKFREDIEKREKESISRTEYTLAHKQVVDRLSNIETRAEKFCTDSDKKEIERRLEQIAIQKAILDTKALIIMAGVAAVISTLIMIGAKILGHLG